MFIVMFFMLFCYRHDSSAPSVVLSEPAHATSCLSQHSLLILFTICRFCASKSVDIKKVVTGSFLCITQKCLRCRQNWIWESQPTVGNVPAGNIYTSAAILYAGALPAQALRIFRILNCPPQTPSDTKAVPSTSHIYNLEKPTISFAIYFESSEVGTFRRWES